MVNDKRLIIFLLLSENLKSTLHIDISEQIFNHLEQFLQAFDYYFPEDPCLKNLWILNPFAINSAANYVTLPTKLENKLIEFSEHSQA